MVDHFFWQATIITESQMHNNIVQGKLKKDFSGYQSNELLIKETAFTLYMCHINTLTA